MDLKRGPFKAEHAGKMNFYCNVVDDRLRHVDDQPTIGIILCQDLPLSEADEALAAARLAEPRADPGSSLPLEKMKRRLRAST